MYEVAAGGGDVGLIGAALVTGLCLIVTTALTLIFDRSGKRSRPIVVDRFTKAETARANDAERKLRNCESSRTRLYGERNAYREALIKMGADPDNVWKGLRE